MQGLLYWYRKGSPIACNSIIMPQVWASAMEINILINAQPYQDKVEHTPIAATTLVMNEIAPSYCCPTYGDLLWRYCALSCW